MKAIFLTAAVTLAAGSMAVAAPSAQTFVHKATVTNTFEIQAGKLALKNSQNAGVRQLANMTMEDHTKNENKLSQMTGANPSDAQMAEGPAQTHYSANAVLDAKHAKMLNALAAKQGSAFDKLIVHDEVGGHEQAIALFKDYAKSGKDAQLRQYADDSLPVLEQHLKKAKSVAQSMK